MNKHEIITTDKYLSLQSDKISYIKTDLLYNNLDCMIWRGNIHTLHPSEVWITGHSDYSINRNLFNKYEHNCNKWFTINKDVDNEKIHALPLGITNLTNESGLHPIYGNVDIMFDIMSQPRDIKNLVYLNFNIDTYRDERQMCYNMFYDKPYVTVGEIINTLDGRRRYLKEIRDHKFVLCPRGNGIDTHRLWETLYMGSIPIVKRCYAMSEFTDLPILFIDNWSEVDKDFLENKYKEITGMVWNLEKIKFSYWKKVITNGL